MIEKHPVNEGLSDILKKSSQLMAEKGFYGTSMRDLAKATGRSLSGLYHYFKNKEDLLYLINYHGFTTLKERWLTLEKTIETPEEKLYAVIYLHIYFFTHHMDEMRIMNLGTHSLVYERAKTIKELKNQYTSFVSDVIKAAYQARCGLPASKEKLARKTFLLFGMMNWIFGWYSEEKYGNVDQLVADCYLTFTQGLFGDQEALKELKNRSGIASKVKKSFAPPKRQLQNTQ